MNIITRKYREWKHRRLIRSVNRYIKNVNNNMIKMNWSRQQRRQFWREFVKSDINTKLTTLAKEK